MFKIIVSVAAATLALGVAGLEPAAAQSGSNDIGVQAQDRQIQEGAQTEDSARGRQRGSLRGAQAGGNNRRSREAQPPSPEQVIAEAQALVTAAGKPCQVTEAVLMGQNEQQQKVFEAACAAGPGYFIVGATPPDLTDCVLLAGRAEIVRGRNPDAPASETATCALPGNQNALAVITAYAREAGIRCEIDQALAAGAGNDGGVIYEIGCANDDGFWLRQLPAGGWDVTECLEIISQGGACRYTTATEQALSLKTRLAGSEAADCDVGQARYMGANANGRFYEVTCAVGDGYIARFNDAGVQQVYACAVAQPIGGGCTLTAAPAAAPAAAPSGGRA